MANRGNEDAGAMDVTPELRKRLRAARAFAGHRAVKDLADAMNARGLGEKTLYALEQGRKESVEERDLWQIARACELPVEFFTEPFENLRTDSKQLGRLEAAVAEIHALVRETNRAIMQQREDGEDLRHALETFEQASAQALQDAPQRQASSG
jgi:transcriptional regulator with XRE-family HTH domain